LVEDVRRLEEAALEVRQVELESLAIEDAGIDGDAAAFGEAINQRTVKGWPARRAGSGRSVLVKGSRVPSSATKVNPGRRPRAAGSLR
jgi:hypothetical protein